MSSFKLDYDDRPVINPPDNVTVVYQPKVILYTAKGLPLKRKIGF